MEDTYTSYERQKSSEANPQYSQLHQTQKRKKARKYQPGATSLWSLVGVLCIIVVYIALLEVLLSRRQREVSNNRVNSGFDNERRQASTTTSIVAPSTYLSLTAPASQVTVTTGQIDTTLFGRNPEDQFTTTTSLITPSTVDPNPADQLTITTGPISSTTGAPNPADQLTITTNPTSTPGDPFSGSQLTITNTGTGNFTVPKNHVEISGPFTKLDYFLSLYLPTLMAVILQTVWAVIFAAFKMMEPFYQLANPEGALAKSSILIEYLSSTMSLSTLRTLFSGHWVMLLVSTVNLLTGLLAPLASESMGVQPTAYCSTPTRPNQPCAPVWIVYLPAARALESLLAFLFVVVLLLLTVSSRRTSPVYENPTSIRSMANLLGDPAVRQDFQDIEPDATKSDVRKALAANRYRLGYFEDSSGLRRFGLTKVTQAEPSQGLLLRHDYTAVDNPSQPPPREQRRQRRSIYFVDALLFLLLLTLFGLILGYYVDHHYEDMFNKFLNSNTFGPRFLLSLLAVLISKVWKRIELETRIMEPYRKLASGPKPGKLTIDITMTGTPYSTVVIALQRGDFIVSWIALITILSEILVVAVTGVPFTPAQTHEAGLACFYISFGILALMVLSLIAVVIRRGTNPKMPRNPDTLAHVWLYLCASIMTQQIGEKSQGEDSQYWFGFSTGYDDKQRWMIDRSTPGMTPVLHSY